MEPVAPQLWLAAGRDATTNTDGVEKTLATWRDYFAPAVVDPVYKEMVYFPQFKRTGQTMDVHVLEYDSLRRKAGPKKQMGWEFPEAFVLALCMHRAALSRRENLLVSANVRGGLGFSDIEKHMWWSRSPGCSGGSGCRYVLGQ